MPACRNLEKHEIPAMIATFSGRTKKRNKALFVMGLMTGFRISELCAIRVKDVLAEGRIKHNLTVSRKNMKGKVSSRTVELNDVAREYLHETVKDLQRQGFFSPDTPLFKSVRAANRALGRSQGYRIINDCAKNAGLSGTIGTHTMRKTFAHNVHQTLLARQAKGEPINPLVATSQALGHSSVQNTVVYLPDSNILIAETIRSLTSLVTGKPGKRSAGL